MFEFLNINKKFFIANREKNKADDIIMEAGDDPQSSLYINRNIRTSKDLDIGGKLYTHGKVELTDKYGKLNYKNMSSIDSVQSGLIGYNNKEWNICSPQQSETLYSKNFSKDVEIVNINNVPILSSYVDKNHELYFVFPISMIINFNLLSFKIFLTNLPTSIGKYYYMNIKFGSINNIIDEIKLDIYDEIKHNVEYINDISFPILLPVHKFKNELFYLKIERDLSPMKGDTLEDKLFIPFINLTYQTNFFSANHR